MKIFFPRNGQQVDVFQCFLSTLVNQSSFQTIYNTLSYLLLAFKVSLRLYLVSGLENYGKLN